MGDWAFNNIVAPIFDTHVRQHVPMYDEIQWMITELSHYFVQEGTNVFDIGCSTGETLMNLYGSHKGRDVKIIGVDNSIDMIKVCKENIDGMKNVSAIYANAQNDVELEMTNASLVVSMLTLQFMKFEDREDMMYKIYKSLNKGGGFIYVEKVYHTDANFNSMFTDTYYAKKIANGVTAQQVIEKTKSIRGVLNPLTVDDNIELMENVGFDKATMFFRWGNFVGFLAIK